MKPRLNLVERLAVAMLVVLAEPEAFGLPSLDVPSGMAYAPLVVLLVATVIDGHRLARWLRAAADAVERG